MQRSSIVHALALAVALAGCAAPAQSSARASATGVTPAVARTVASPARARARVTPVAVGDVPIVRVPIGNSPVLGNPAAPVTVVVFSDFQCPFCIRAEDTLRELRSRYGDRIRIVWKNSPLPFHAHAEPAAELALEARAQRGDAAFWAVHDALVAKRGRLEDADLRQIAAAAGLDVDAAMRAVANRRHAVDIEQDMRTAADAGVSGTPTFFINGRKLVGAQPIDRFVELVDRALADAPR